MKVKESSLGSNCWTRVQGKKEMNESSPTQKLRRLEVAHIPVINIIAENNYTCTHVRVYMYVLLHVVIQNCSTQLHIMYVYNIVVFFYL